jgi:2'-5' RNA ligase
MFSISKGLRNMPEQQLFLPFDPDQTRRVERPRKAEPDRVFFAILPPRHAALAIAERIRLLRAEHELRGRPTAATQLHISLHGLGRFFQIPSVIIASAREAGASVAMRPFEIAFDRVLSFGKGDGKRPLVLRPGDDTMALAAFHRRLGDAMTKAGLRRSRASHFTPHMTLLYDDRAVKEQAIAPIRFPVDGFVLVHSLVGRSRYIELARWPLRG